MAKFNTATARRVTSPITSETTPSGVNHHGAPGYRRDTNSELFMLAVTNMYGQKSHHEGPAARQTRYTDLVAQTALADPDWTVRFVEWLRTEAHMRSASATVAADYVHARLNAGDTATAATTTNRAVINSVLQRADEPGEMLAYWTTVYGRNIPKPVKRGIADAVSRLYTERSLLKWDSNARGYRFGDVIDLVHPTPSDARQGALFEHALDRRHNRANPIPESLTTLRARAELMSIPVRQRRALLVAGGTQRLRAAAMTWEALAGWLQAPMDATAWEAVIPIMGYMALLRNLRNFDQAGVSDDVAEQVAERLADPAQVARERQFPMRYLSAYRAALSLRWARPLDKALTASLSNVPRLGGRTLILVDTSTSMNDVFSQDGTLARWDAAAIFGVALGSRCEHADVVSFSSARRYINDPPGPRTKLFPLQRGESLLRSVERWRGDGYFLGGGTDTAGAVRRHLSNHDRLVILTDEQADQGDVNRVVPDKLPFYTWNLAGYQHGHAPSGSGTRHTFGGLTDTGFRMIPLLEAGRSASWPF